MFERYTEKARRVIFFARYEASQFGAPAIEPEHLLLGLMREDRTLTQRFFPARTDIEAIRREIESRKRILEKIHTAVELPLAPETKSVLVYAQEESDGLQHRHIGTEHLLLGLLREEGSIAAEILYGRGLRLNAVREEIGRESEFESVHAATPKHFRWLEEIQACAERVATLSNTIMRELGPEASGARFQPAGQSSKNYSGGQGSLALKDKRSLSLGLETLLRDRLDLLRGARVGLICNQASVDHGLRHAADLLHEHSEINLKALFGPQHGIRGEVQDNMVETGHAFDTVTGLPIYSLYSETREPTERMLENLDLLVFDLQDVGCRIYTFIYTLANCMRAAERFGKKVLVCDRPNPITGEGVAGTVLEPEFASFVGQFPIATRHGMTVGELAGLFKEHFQIGCDLEVIKMSGWSRELWMDETDAPWVLPSPNMPTLEAATVFPGTVHLEGTLVSEGRGTTRPFELIGAPFIEAAVYAERLNALGLSGVYFRPCGFQPTFQKHARENCGGVQIHVTDREKFEPVLAGVAAVKIAYDLYTDEFRWKEPPYEYVYDKNPFDVIAGTDKLRLAIERGDSLEAIEASWHERLEDFKRVREGYLLY